MVDIELPYDERIVVNTFFGRNTIDVSQADIEYVKYLDRPRGGSNDVFGFGGSNPYFNVAGRGIGLFIGASSTGEVRVPLEPVQ